MEDNSADVALVKEALEEQGVRCELTVIPNGELAIRFIEEINAGAEPCPRLVIIDLNLPKKPGREVLRKLRSSSLCGDMPVIVLSSSDSRQDRDDVAQFPPSRYIRKPYNLDEFLNLGAVFKQYLAP